MAQITLFAGPGVTIPMEDDSQLAELVFRLREGLARNEPVVLTLDVEGEPRAESFCFTPGTSFVAQFDDGYPAELDKRIGDMLDGLSE